MCLFYLLGLCKFGAAQCVYAHDRTHLSRGPWDDREWAPRMRNMLGPVRGAHSAPMLEQLAPLLKPDQPLHARGFLPTERVRALERATFAYAVSYDDDDDDGAPAGRRRGRAHRRWEEEEDEAEMEERMANMGFSNAELGDLLAQGVKPWDDDAWVRIRYAHRCQPWLTMALGRSACSAVVLKRRQESMRERRKSILVYSCGQHACAWR